MAGRQDFRLDFLSPEPGSRVHADIRKRCSAFEPINGVSVLCEPFYSDDRTDPIKGNPEGGLGIVVVIQCMARTSSASS